MSNQTFTLPADIGNALVQLSAATLVDALNRLGYRKVFMEGVRTLTPGQKLVGRAVTLRFLPVRPDLLEETRRGPESPEYRAIEQCGPGRVLVVDGMGLPFGSIGGEIKFLRLKQRRAEGIVTDAAIRDSNAVRAYGLKLFAQNGTAQQGTVDFLPYGVNEYIKCGGVLVRPGDYIVGEDDGVVVVPHHIVEKVIQEAREHERLESFILQRLEKEKVSPGHYYPLGDPGMRDKVKALMQQEPRA